MIIVLFAGTPEALRAVYGHVNAQHKGLLDYVNLGTTDSEKVRLNHAANTGCMFTEHRVTLVFNPQNAEELKLLRSRKAIICHQYGSNLSRPIYNDVSCARGDFYFTDKVVNKCLPGHVLTPDELLSECRIKHRNNRVSAKKSK